MVHRLVEIMRKTVVVTIAVEANCVRECRSSAQAVPRGERALQGGHAEGKAGAEDVESDAGRTACTATQTRKLAIRSVDGDVLGRKERGVAGLCHIVGDVLLDQRQHTGGEQTGGLRRTIGPDLELHDGMQSGLEAGERPNAFRALV